MLPLLFYARLPIDLLRIVLFLPGLGALMYHTALHETMENLRRQFPNIQITVYDLQKLVNSPNICLLGLQFRLHLGDVRFAFIPLRGVAAASPSFTGRHL